MKVKRAKKKVITEAPDKFRDIVNNAIQNAGINTEETVTTEDKPHQIELALDRALKVNRRNQKNNGKNFSNIALVGTAGVGKTAIVMDWADRHGLDLVVLNTSTMDETDLTGVIARSADGTSTVRLRSDVLKGLNNPDAVLFLDEYNRGRKSVRGTLLTLVNNHLVDAGTDQESNVKGLVGKIKLPFLFTVAAFNPATGEYSTDELDPAEISRFRRIEVQADKAVTLNYLKKEISRQANALDPDDPDFERDVKELMGQIELAKVLLSDNRFQFDSEEDERAGYQKYGRDYTPLSPRSLTNLLQSCDGTKEDFLDLYNDFTSPLKKNLVANILANYKDVDDKANSVFKKREKSNEEILDDFLNSF